MGEDAELKNKRVLLTLSIKQYNDLKAQADSKNFNVQSFIRLAIDEKLKTRNYGDFDFLMGLRRELDNQLKHRVSYTMSRNYTQTDRNNPVQEFQYLRRW